MLDTPTLVPPIFDAPNISKSLEFEIVQALTEPSINLYPSNKRKIYGVHEILPYFVVSGSVALSKQYTILGTCLFREETFSIVQL